MASEKRNFYTKGSAPQSDIYEQTTQKILSLMEQGKLPWQSGWDKNTGAALVCPINGKNGYRYGQINSVYLSFIMAEKESDDPRFFTMLTLKKQNAAFRARIASLKAQGKPINPELTWEYGVKKGAKAVRIQISWKQTTDKFGNPLPEEEQYWRRDFRTVFHASDCVRREYLQDEKGRPILKEDGKRAHIAHPLKPYVPKEKGYTHEEQYEIAEGILKESGAIIRHDVPAVCSSPCYIPAKDEIHLPPKESFENLGEYYATALHELAHWTSHKDRLGRYVTKDHTSPAYAKEELRAELASTYLSLDLGLPMNPTNHAAYVQHWMKNLKENKMEIFHAATEARKIVGYLKKFMPARFLLKDMLTEDEIPLTAVADTNTLQLPPEAQALGTARFYKYLLTEHPADAGKVPKDHLYLIDPNDKAARYGAVYYEKQLPASVAATYELTPDYNYFANKSVHVTLYQQKEDTSSKQSSSRPLQLNRDYDITAQENYIRTDTMRERGLDCVFARLCMQALRSNRPITEGDLIEMDGRVFQVNDVGFCEQKLNAHQGDFVLTPLEDERVKELCAAAEERVGKDTYEVYREKIREMFYRAAQTEDTLRTHPGIFVETDDPKEGQRLALDADYARDFRERAYREGLSSYTPTDEAGWRKVDKEFAENTLKAALETDPDAAGRIDELCISIAETVQRNSPYTVVSQNRSYGTQIMQEVEKKTSIGQRIKKQKEERKTEEKEAERPAYSR